MIQAMAKGDRYLVYADSDDGEIKIHGPLNAEQAEGFYSGAEWVNDSAIEFIGVYRGIEAARSAAAEQAKSGEYLDYELEEMGFEVPQLEVNQGGLYLLYLDDDYDTLKIHGPLSLSRAEGFYAGVEWVNDSALEYQGVYAGAEVARSAAAEQASGGQFEIEEFTVETGVLGAAGLEI
jgi:hypothetical protein